MPAKHVDVIVGSNTDDWKLFLVASGEIAQIAEQTLTAPIDVEGYHTLEAYGLPVQTALHAYRGAYPVLGPGDLLAKVQTDWWTRIPALRLAEAHANDAGAAFMYEFAWPSPVFNAAVHALEIPFVFDTLDPDLPLLGPIAWPGATTAARRPHARRLGLLRRLRRPRMAEVRPRPQSHHALRRHLARGRRSLGRERRLWDGVR